MVYYSALCNTNGKLDKAYGKQERFVVRHSPFVLYKNVYEKIFLKWRAEIYNTLLHRFRNSRDILFHYLHHYFVINEGKSCNYTHIIDNVGDLQDDAVLFRIEDDQKSLDWVFKQIEINEPRFYTLNDVFQKPETAQKLKAYLGKKYPIPSSFEIKGLPQPQPQSTPSGMSQGLS